MPHQAAALYYLRSWNLLVFRYYCLLEYTYIAMVKQTISTS